MAKVGGAGAEQSFTFDNLWSESGTAQKLLKNDACYLSFSPLHLGPAMKYVP
ncbi:hypothetical protein WUBG_08442, partial [Wuchereria bancrofti]